MPTIEQAQQWYPADDPVHGFDHVLRVHAMAQQIGRELGADLEILQAASLLHDAAGADPRENRAEHQKASAVFARQVLQGEGWSGERIQAVMHCIESHRYRGQVQPETLEAKILFDADKLDVLGAFGIGRTIGYAVQAGQPIYAAPSERFAASGEPEPGEPHSAYHEYLFKLRNVRSRLHTAPAERIAERREQLLRSYFEQLAAEARGGG